MNPRYLAYCRAHGEPDPEQMMARDREEWKGGVIVGYIIWIGQRWREWRELNGYRHDAYLSDADHAAFDAWLDAVVAAGPPA